MAKLTLLAMINHGRGYEHHIYKLIIVSIIIVAGSCFYFIALDQ
ncbi:hypothetical protein [Photobacterium phosphoreum]|jgi:hypothetical protein|nr:hypothetical protein [Photobacterium phosphoreum]